MSELGLGCVKTPPARVRLRAVNSQRRSGGFSPEVDIYAILVP